MPEKMKETTFHFDPMFNSPSSEGFNFTTMYKCYAFLHGQRNREINEAKPPIITAGYANGYVAVPPEHPLFGKGYDEAAEEGIETHGGLTFCEKSDILINAWNNDTLELLDGAIPVGYWVFGFDTIHCYDSLQTCPREYVVNTVMELKHDLENFDSPRMKAIERESADYAEQYEPMYRKVVSRAFKDGVLYGINIGKGNAKLPTL